MNNSNPEPTEPAQNDIVCDACFEQNLSTNVHIQKCVVCSEPYCSHHASTVDPTHCSDCLYDVSVQIDTITKIESSSIGSEGGTAVSYTHLRRRTKFNFSLDHPGSYLWLLR